VKQNIHPKYFDKASVRCACGNSWITGSTLPEVSVEICNHCHPFYTGKEKLVDTRGRIDKFKKRQSRAEEAKKVKPTKKARPKKQLVK
jgi:large subunit ribosomal protein L31